MKLKALLAVTIIILASLTVYAQDPPLGVLTEIGIDSKLGAQLPLDLMFRDETGTAVPLKTFFTDKPVVLVPVYYECSMLCSLVLNGFTKALRALEFTPGQEFQIVTFSIDPKDQPTVAAEKRAGYLKDYGRDGADSGWRFLTGDEQSIQALTDAMGYRYKFDPYTKQWAHVSSIMIATPDGILSQYLYGIEFSARDLRLSLVTASEKKIGTLVDQIYLYCYHYDPVTGKYGFAIMNTLRVAGIATVLALVAFVVSNIRRKVPAPSKA